MQICQFSGFKWKFSNFFLSVNPFLKSIKIYNSCIALDDKDLVNLKLVHLYYCLLMYNYLYTFSILSLQAFCLSFLSQLDNESHTQVTKIITQQLLGKNESSVLKQSIPEPSGGNHIPISGYWIRSGKLEPNISENYIFTNTVKRNLQDLARIVSAWYK